MAGFVAESTCDDSGSSADDLLEVLEFDENAVSPSDRRGIPDDPNLQLAAITEAIETLKLRREFFAWAVESLYSEHAITDGMARDQWQELYPDSDKPAKHAGRVRRKTRSARTKE